MASVSSAHLVLFIAAILVAAVLAGTMTQGASRVGSAIRDDSEHRAADVDAELRVVSDPGSPGSVYENGTLTLYVKNTGDGTLPSAPDDVAVLVNGTHQPDVRTTVLDGEDWTAGSLLRVRVNVSLPANSSTRVTVVVTGAEDLFTFRTA